MRLLKYSNLILLLCSIIILVSSFFVVFGLYMKNHDVSAAIIKARADLATCREIIDLKYPGEWSVQEGELYKGPYKISFNNPIVDHLSSLTGDTITVFLGETRVATTVRSSNGERVLAAKVSPNVVQTVLQDGQIYFGEDDNLSQWNEAGYVPLSAGGKVIGILCVDITHADEGAFFIRSLPTMTKWGLAVIVLIALLTCFLLRNVITYPWQNIVAGPREAAAGLTPNANVICAKEIEELKDVFNNMVEQIQALTGEINRVSTHSTINEDPPKNEIPTIVKFTKDDEAINESTIEPNVVTRLMPESSLDSPWYNGSEGLPKGLSKVTLDHIVQFLQVTRRPLSAEEVAEGVKLTRVTVRHYLEFLEQRRVLKSELKYGTGGRPVKLFILL